MKSEAWMKYQGDSCPVILMLVWDYEQTIKPQRRIVPFSLASALGHNGCSYKIQAIEIDGGYIIEEWKKDLV